MDLRRPTYILALVLVLAALTMSHAGSQETYSWQVNYQHVILDIDNKGYVDMQYEIDANIQQGVWTEVWIPQTKSNMKVNKVIDGDGVEHSFTIDSGQIKVGGFNLKPGDHVNLKLYSTLYEFVFKAREPGYMIVTFTPDWWDMYIKDTQVKYYLPGLVNGSEVFTGSQEYSSIMVEGNRTAVYFESGDLSANQQFETSVSFPDGIMDPSVTMSGTDISATPYPMSAGASLCACMICLSPFLILIIPAIYIFGKRKPYYSPVVGMAGISVNKNLDPVEAATLLRIDPRRILTMIMFGMMKKGNIELMSTDPIQLEFVSGQDLNYYEKLFADAIIDDQLDEDKLLVCFKVLARTVVDKTRPYSRNDTENYYHEKISQAWDQIKAVDTPELKLQKYDTDMFWLMADEQFKQKTIDYVSNVPGSTTVYVPSHYWWYPYYVGTPYRYHSGRSTVTTPTGSTYQPPTDVSVGGRAPGEGQMTTASVESFANSISNSVESLSSGVVGGVESFVGVRNEANMPPPAISVPISRPAPGPATFAGRSSCACAHCACACAHCACACACAGGGHGCT
jgi:hypothetical protein